MLGLEKGRMTPRRSEKIIEERFDLSIPVLRVVWSSGKTFDFYPSLVTILK